MADVVIILTILAFVAVCVGYVEWCDRIVRRDQPAVVSETSVQREAVEVSS